MVVGRVVGALDNQRGLRSRSASTDRSYNVANTINLMFTGWCEKKPSGSICRMLEWKEQQRMAEESEDLQSTPRPKSDATEIRSMHEW